MKGKKSYKKKEANYRNADNEIRIKERRKNNDKKINKRNIYDLIEEDEDIDMDIYDYLNDEE